MAQSEKRTLKRLEIPEELIPRGQSITLRQWIELTESAGYDPYLDDALPLRLEVGEYKIEIDALDIIGEDYAYVFTLPHAFHAGRELGKRRRLPFHPHPDRSGLPRGQRAHSMSVHKDGEQPRKWSSGNTWSRSWSGEGTSPWWDLRYHLCWLRETYPELLDQSVTRESLGYRDNPLEDWNERRLYGHSGEWWQEHAQQACSMPSLLHLVEM